MNIGTVTVQEAMIDSTWCGRSRPLQNRTEIADMLRGLNKCRRVKGSAVARAGARQREGATESGRSTTARQEIRPKNIQRLKGNKKTGRPEELGAVQFL